MAVTIGALVIDFQASTAKLRGDLGKAVRAVNSSSAKMNRALAVVEKAGLRLGRRFGKLGKSVFSLKGGIATLVGGAGIGLLIKRSIDAGDTIAKVADSIGISTDALQEYRFAADIAGTSQQALDGAFQAFTKRLGEARAGTGTLITILNKYDKTLLKNLQTAGSTEEAIEIYFRALDKAKNSADRAALSAAAFGRQAGVAMTNLVKRGAAEIARMREQARSLGVVMEEDLLRKAEGAKDALTILGTVIKAKVTIAVLKLAPTIVQLAGAFTRLIPKIERAITTSLEFFGVIDRKPAEKIKFLRKELEGIQRLQTMGSLGRGVAQQFLPSGFPNLPNAKELEARRRQIEDEIRLQKIILDERRRLSGRIPLLRPVKIAAGGGGTGGNPSKDALKAAAAAVRQHKRELDKIRSAAQSVFEGTRTPIERYNIRIKELNALVRTSADDVNKAGISWDTYGRAVRQAQDELDANAKSLEGVRDGFKEVGVAALDSLGSIATGATSAREALAGMLNTLSRVFSRVAGTALEKLIDGAFKSSPSGKKIALSPASTGFAPTGFNANDPLTRFAHGGSGVVTGAGGTDSQTVAFRATPGERVTVQTPAQQRGGGGTTIIIDLRGSNGSEELQRTVRQGIAAAAPLIVESAVETVRDGAGRTKKFFPGR